MTPVEDPGAIRAALAAGEVRRVLVVRAARVGDTLHVLPALSLLRRALPAGQLTFLCSHYARAVGRAAPVDRVVTYAHKGRGPRSHLGRRRVRRELGGLGPWDLYLGLEDKPWGRRLAQELGCRFLHTASGAGQHVVERKAGVLQPLGLWDGSTPPPPIRWGPPAVARALAESHLADLPGPRVGLQSGSYAGRSLLGARRRRDPAPTWVTQAGLALHRELGASLVLQTGLGGSERRAARRTARDLRAAGARVLLLEGLRLDVLGAVLAGLDAYVTANTGPAHLAAAVETPVVLLEGPSTAAARPWCPPDRLRVLNLELPCSPCRGTAHGRRCPVPRCLDELPAAGVVEAVRGWVGRRGGS